MSRADRRGFTILEAIVALAIVGFAAVAAVEAVGSELRGADRAALAYTTAALAQDRLVAVTILDGEQLNPLPDSVARGAFPAPFEAYHWVTLAFPVFGKRDMYDVSITVTSDRTEFALATRLYRPHRDPGL